MKLGRLLLWLFLLIIVAGTAAGTTLMLRNDNGEISWKTHLETEVKVIEPTSEAVVVQEKKQPETVIEPQTQVLPEGEVPKPKIDKQLLTKNKYSRPGKKVEEIKYLVIHYLGNPRTTAQENRDYFESLKDLKNATMSSNYIVGLDGEIIQCVPDGEMAYASNNANKESISIENCNIDKTGKFLKDTYISLVKLTAYLAEKYDLDRDHIIRHHDVTGKECPLYYVENEEAWEVFLDDVMFYIELCHKNSPDLKKLEDVLDGLEYTYDSKFDGSIILEEKKDDKESGRPHDVDGASGETEAETASHEEKREESYEENRSEDRAEDHYQEDHYYEDYDHNYDNSYEDSYDDSYDNSYDYGYDNYYDNGNNDYNHADDNQQYQPEPAPQGPDNLDEGIVDVPNGASNGSTNESEGMYDDGIVEMEMN